MYRENEYWDIGYDEKKIQMQPSCGEPLFTQPKKKSEERERRGESKSASVFPNHTNQTFPRAVPVQKASKEEQEFTFYRAVIWLDPEPLGIPVEWWIELTGFECKGGEDSRFEAVDWKSPSRADGGE